MQTNINKHCPTCGAFTGEVSSIKDWSDHHGEHCQRSEEGYICTKCGREDLKIT